MAPPSKKMRFNKHCELNVGATEDKALIQLHNLGDLRGFITDGILHPVVKKALNQLSSKQLRIYFTTDNQGRRLFADLCAEGDIAEIRYVIDKLRCSYVAFQRMSARVSRGCLQLPLDWLSEEFLKGIDDLEELLEMKYFILSSGFFEVNDPASVLRHIRTHCQTILRKLPAPVPLRIFPLLYKCLREDFSGTSPSDSALAASIGSAIRWINPRAMEKELDDLKDYLDELLFLAAFGTCEPNPLQDHDYSTPVVLRLVLNLLNRGASPMRLRGHSSSTMKVLVKNFQPLPPPLQGQLIRHACCKLDLTDSECALLGIPSSSKGPQRLRCLAAQACPAFERRVLVENLPATLVPIAARHPARQ